MTPCMCLCTRITLSLMSVYPRGEICLPSTRRWICLTRDACFSTRRWIYVQREMHFLYKEMSMFNVRCIFSTRRWIYVQREMHFLYKEMNMFNERCIFSSNILVSVGAVCLTSYDPLIVSVPKHFWEPKHVLLHLPVTNVDHHHLDCHTWKRKWFRSLFL